jgi:DNA-directed RNA polymerase subunit H (RpoH/RPB5)
MITAEIIYKIRLTLSELLEDRGFGNRCINTGLSIEEIEIIAEEFKTNDSVLDIFIPAKSDEESDFNDFNEEERESVNKLDKKVYIKWFSKVEGEKSENLFNKTYDMITEINGMGRNDDIIFILGDLRFDKLTDQMKEWVNGKPNVSLFNYKDLLFNISRHKYVPKHIKLTKTEILDLKKSLRLESLLQLPLIERNDPVARYYGLRRGDVVRIERCGNIAGLIKEKDKIAIDSFHHNFYRLCS